MISSYSVDQKDILQIIFDCSLSIDILDNFEEWSMWTPCTGTCGVGTRKRSRECQAGFECLGQCDQVEKCTTPCRLANCSCMVLFV